MHKPFYIFFGFIFLILGFLGLVLPGLPGTPFFLLSAYLFSKSSKRLHKWLTSLPYVGDVIINWERHRAISRKSKWQSLIILVVAVGYTLIFSDLSAGVKLTISGVVLMVLSFIWTRSDGPNRNEESKYEKTSTNSFSC